MSDISPSTNMNTKDSDTLEGAVLPDGNKSLNDIDEEEKQKAAQNEKKLKKRKFVLDEIISTERTYVNGLLAVKNAYLLPLQQTTILSPEDIQNQFFSWESLCGLHENLLTNLQKPDANVGDIFHKLSYFLRMYLQYLSNFTTAQVKRGDLLTNNSRFSQFVEEAKLNPVCNGQDIESLLILPVQRIPRYRLLLEELLKCTPEDHAEFPLIQQALTRVSEVAAANNQDIKERDSRKKLMDIMMSFDEKSRVNLMDDPSRKFLKEATFSRQCRRGVKEFHFWLFSDCLIYGEINVLNKYKINRQIAMNEVEVKIPSSRCENIDCAIQLESSVKSFIFWAKDKLERDVWLKLLVDLSVSEKSRRGVTSHRAPLWTPDSAGIKCVVCHESFNMITRRRHHCRNCGELVCANCSTGSILLPHLSKLPVRACDSCIKMKGLELKNPDSEDPSSNSIVQFVRSSIMRKDSNAPVLSPQSRSSMINLTSPSLSPASPRSNPLSQRCSWSFSALTSFGASEDVEVDAEEGREELTSRPSSTYRPASTSRPSVSRSISIKICENPLEKRLHDSTRSRSASNDSQTRTISSDEQVGISEKEFRVHVEVDDDRSSTSTFVMKLGGDDKGDDDVSSSDSDEDDMDNRVIKRCVRRSVRNSFHQSNDMALVESMIDIQSRLSMNSMDSTDSRNNDSERISSLDSSKKSPIPKPPRRNGMNSLCTINIRETFQDAKPPSPSCNNECTVDIEKVKCSGSSDSVDLKIQSVTSHMSSLTMNEALDHPLTNIGGSEFISSSNPSDANKSPRLPPTKPQKRQSVLSSNNE